MSTKVANVQEGSSIRKEALMQWIMNFFSDPRAEVAVGQDQDHQGGIRARNIAVIAIKLKTISIQWLLISLAGDPCL